MATTAEAEIAKNSNDMDETATNQNENDGNPTEEPPKASTTNLKKRRQPEESPPRSNTNTDTDVVMNDTEVVADDGKTHLNGNHGDSANNNKDETKTPNGASMDNSSSAAAAASACTGMTLEEMGISETELEVTVKVLQKITSLVNAKKKKKKKRNRNKKKKTNGAEEKNEKQQEEEEDDTEEKETEEEENAEVKFYRNNSALRPFRKAIAPIVQIQQRSMYDGKQQGDYLQHRNTKQALKRQRLAETTKQQKYLDTTQLRRGRIDKLNALKEDAKDEEMAKHLELLVPDGAVEGDGPAALLTNGNESENNDQMTTDLAKKDDPQEQESVNLPKLRSCYVCKIRFRELHHFYDQLCPKCAPLNYTKRNFSTDLSNRVAVVTGSRVKIGFHTCLKLLRANCLVIATTRFPNAACKAYMAQPDFETFKDRLHVYGLDLRDVTGLEAFTRFLRQRYEKVDILINNACQTIRRPAGYYRPAVMEEQRLYEKGGVEHHNLLLGGKAFEVVRRKLTVRNANSGNSDGNAIGGAGDNMQGQFLLADHNTSDSIDDTSNPIAENVQISTDSPISKEDTNKPDHHQAIIPTNATSSSSKKQSPSFETTGISHSAIMSQMTILPEDVGVDSSILPQGLSDINGQQLDLRRHNSWLLKMENVSTPEVVEAMFINAIAPFVLNSRLKPLMMAPNEDGSDRPDRFIINVSAMEGKFYRYKMPHHPHTNMAKAALNMLTRTSSEDLAKRCRIYMNSVDTGWINDENPLEKAAKIAKCNHFQTPIDEVDAAARILDPIFTVVSGGKKEYGCFYKDYKKTEW